MADLNFPSNPSPGDTFTVGSKTYVWNSYAWIVASSTVTASGITSTGTVNITGGTTASSTVTGDLVVSGGVGIGGDLYIGGTLFSSGSPVLTTANFTATVVDGIDIDIVELESGILEFNNVSTLQTVTGRGNSTTNIVSFLNTTNSTSTDTGAVTIVGGIGIGGRVTAESVRIADTVFDSTQTLVNTADPTVIDTFNLGEFRSAKYLIQIDEGIGAGADFELIEVLLVADNEGNVWATEYGVVTSNGYLGTLDAEVAGGIVNLYLSPFAATNKTVKVLRTGMAA